MPATGYANAIKTEHLSLEHGTLTSEHETLSLEQETSSLELGISTLALFYHFWERIICNAHSIRLLPKTMI